MGMEHVSRPVSHSGGVDLGNGVQLVLWHSGSGQFGSPCCKCMSDVQDDPSAFSLTGAFGSSRNFHSSCARCEWCDAPVSVAQRNFRPVHGKLKLRRKIKCVQCCNRDGDAVNVTSVN